VQFTDLSTAGAGNTNVSWQWDFGNGNTSTAQNPVYTYTTAGTFTITLRVTNDKGCVKTISRPNYIGVTPGVTAIFSHSQPVVCRAPADITFTNNSTGPGVLSWQWDFGDGNTSTLQNPIHTYTVPGSYSVTLIVTSSSGCQDTARTAVPVTIGGITTNFTGPNSVCTNAVATFTNTSSPSGISSFWNFGDGGTSTVTNPTHTYTAPGTYTVTLYNTYANCTDSAAQPITVNTLPVANFTAPVRFKCEPSLIVNFQDLSTGAVSWQWNFGDGNTSALQNPVHTYTNYGNYNVTLTVTNALGCTHTIVQPDFIIIRRATISIAGLPARGCIPFTFAFNPNVLAVDIPTSFLWDFGDGNTSTSNPTHTYTTQGTYTFKLFMTTSTGCTDSLVITNAIQVGSKPVADFSASPIPVCAYQPVQFTDISVPADEWLWNFGDGNYSALQNPSHTYIDTGYFGVTLIATNNGCADTIVKPAYIQVLPPIARFIYAANCSNRVQFSFTDQSIGAASWSWDFGDGSPVSTSQNPVHSFPGLGPYNVILTVTNGSCSHSVAHTLQVIDQAPDFSANLTSICRGTAIVLTPVNVNSAITSSLVWDLGNGVQVSTGVGPFTYLYPASGTYTVSLMVSDINGCRDTVSKNNFIRVNGPVANFSAINVGGCTGLTTTFNNLSTTDGINPITNWLWDFGDGNIQSFSAPPFLHTYNTTGIFSVKLKVTDAIGCSDSLIVTNLITTTDPVPDFISADTLTCPGAIVNFTNTSVGTALTSFWNFGDGNTSVLTSPTHSYTTTGMYTVKLYITDAYGCIDSVIKNNYIRVSRPVAGFTVSDSIGSCTPLEVQFTNTSTYYTSSLWDFGPGEGTSTLTNPVHYYSLPGTYRVKLLVTSLGGCTDSAFINIIVNDTTGSTITYTPIGGCNPLTVNLNTNTSAVIQSYFWDFGDGNTITTNAPNITHVYTTFGSFVPKVIMLDPAGCLIPLTGIDTIKIVGANPDFGFTPAFLCDSGYVHFSDSTTSSDPVINYNWAFGDGGTSTLQNPSHFYTTPGIFDVSLTVRTQSGCQNTVTIPAAIKVVLRPLIDIVGNTIICIDQSILHSGIFLRPDTSIVTWVWTFPNGNTSSIQNPPQQTYNTAGSFTVTAISTNSSGCKDTATQNILVNPLPTVTMPGQMTIQAGFPVQIPATYSTGTNSWTWSPATGLSCISCPAPDAGPKFNTTYKVIFSDENGCINQDTILVIVVCKDGNLFMPNTFSPNGDGSNDMFYPRGKGLYSIKVLRIFNRWGEIVFEKRDFPVNNALSGWDGTYKGKKPQADVYVYQVEVFCDNGEMIKLNGNIALIL
jgi:gliding motility-associated-like protein